jgi:hypothetical protein
MGILGYGADTTYELVGALRRELGQRELGQRSADVRVGGHFHEIHAIVRPSFPQSQYAG